MALAYKRGELPKSDLTGSALSMTKSMSEKDLQDFASTMKQGLPEYVKKEK